MGSKLGQAVEAETELDEGPATGEDITNVRHSQTIKRGSKKADMDAVLEV